MTCLADKTATFDRTYETVLNGFVTPTVVHDGLISGCVYNTDGQKVRCSERFGGWKGDLFKSNNPDRLQRPDCIEQKGRGIYLGSLMAGHYGHFITEGLSTFWIFETQSPENFDYFLFSPFVFGTRFPSYAVECLRTFGIDPEKVVIVGEKPVAFEELVVPERLFRLNHSADPTLAWVYQKIRSGIGEAHEPLNRIYLSRRKLSLKQLTRVIANEVEIEMLFRQAGFTVVYPEELLFQDQLALYANASVVAGPSGSALHNSLFMRPGAKLIELGDPRYSGERSPTQVLCDFVAQVDTVLIPFTGTMHDEKKSALVDIEDLRVSLIGVLDRISMPSPALKTFQSRNSLLNKIEIMYLTYRPPLVNRLKKLISTLRTKP